MFLYNATIYRVAFYFYLALKSILELRNFDKKAGKWVLRFYGLVSFIVILKYPH